MRLESFKELIADLGLSKENEQLCGNLSDSRILGFEFDAEDKAKRAMARVMEVETRMDTCSLTAGVPQGSKAVWVLAVVIFQSTQEKIDAVVGAAGTPSVYSFHGDKLLSHPVGKYRPRQPVLLQAKILPYGAHGRTKGPRLN